MSKLREINVRLLTDVVKGTAPGVKSIESMKRFNGDRGIQSQLIQRDLALSSNHHCDFDLESVGDPFQGSSQEAETWEESEALSYLNQQVYNYHNYSVIVTFQLTSNIHFQD